MRLCVSDQKSSPALSALLNARASVLVTPASWRISSLSKVAPRPIGSGNDVAHEKGPLLAKFTPGEPAPPCSASLHHSYAGRPRRGTPGLLLANRATFSVEFI